MKLQKQIIKELEAAMRHGEKTFSFEYVMDNDRLLVVEGEIYESIGVEQDGDGYDMERIIEIDRQYHVTRSVLVSEDGAEEQIELPELKP
jgi:hypothetical protein